MSLSYLRYDIVDKTAVITIDREKVYNALCKDAKAEIVSRIQDANSDDNIRSIIITGSGEKAFCTGQDLNDRSANNTGDEEVDLGNLLETEWNPLMQVVRHSQKPVIAAVNGVAAGAGLSLALNCDLIVAKEKARFISGFSKLGLCPDAGSSYLLSRAMGYQKTLNFFLNNETLYSEDLEKYGLINIITTEVLRDAVELAKKINKLAPMSVMNIKKNVQFAYQNTYKDSLALETEAQRFLGKSEDYKEGVQAFFEKREPNFKGI